MIIHVYRGIQASQAYDILVVLLVPDTREQRVAVDAVDTHEIGQLEEKHHIGVFRLAYGLK